MIYRSQEFLEALVKLDRGLRDRVLNTMEKFEDSPDLPGLRLEKLSGLKNLWSIRVTRGCRIILSKQNGEDGDKWVFEDVGPHDIYRRVGR